MTRILGIETSCDETGIALYDSERGILAEALYSQIQLHQLYGGVVPELASRDHIRKTLPLIQEVLDKAGATLADIDGIPASGANAISYQWKADGTAISGATSSSCAPRTNNTTDRAR